MFSCVCKWRTERMWKYLTRKPIFALRGGALQFSAGSPVQPTQTSPVPTRTPVTALLLARSLQHTPSHSCRQLHISAALPYTHKINMQCSYLQPGMVHSSCHPRLLHNHQSYPWAQESNGSEEQNQPQSVSKGSVRRRANQKTLLSNQGREKEAVDANALPVQNEPQSVFKGSSRRRKIKRFPRSAQGKENETDTDVNQVENPPQSVSKGSMRRRRNEKFPRSDQGKENETLYTDDNQVQKQLQSVSKGSSKRRGTKKSPRSNQARRNEAVADADALQAQNEPQSAPEGSVRHRAYKKRSRSTHTKQNKAENALRTQNEPHSAPKCSFTERDDNESPKLIHDRQNETVQTLQTEANPQSASKGLLLLSRQIEKAYVAQRETFGSFQHKEAQRRKLEKVVWNCFKDAALVHVGSSASGFSTSSSDSDLCLCFAGRNTLSKTKIVNVLHDLRAGFLPLLGNKKVKVISEAFVPVLVINSKSGSGVDITVNNLNGLRNPYLMLCYGAVDCRVTKLVVTVKSWAKQAGITDAKQNKLSGFGLALLVIHYLQAHCSPPVLPSLHQEYPEWFKRPDLETSLTRVKDRYAPDFLKERASPNTQSLGELLLGFFEFYSSYDWDKVISIRKPTFRIRKSRVFKHSYICIEDPSNGGNVSRAVSQVPQFKQITRAFSWANQSLQRKPDLRCIMKITGN